MQHNAPSAVPLSPPVKGGSMEPSATEASNATRAEERKRGGVLND